MGPERSRGETARHASADHPWWLLLLPASFLLHIAEEWWGGEGFAAWTTLALGAPITTTRFVAINAVVWPLFATLTVLGITRLRFAWFPTALATLTTVNAGLHVLGSLGTSSYSPGLVTALLLYVPVGSFALLHGRRVLSAARFRLGVAAGLLVHAVVLVVAFV